jgi:hypothetical protein
MLMEVLLIIQNKLFLLQKLDAEIDMLHGDTV